MELNTRNLARAYDHLADVYSSEFNKFFPDDIIYLAMGGDIIALPSNGESMRRFRLIEVT